LISYIKSGFVSREWQVNNSKIISESFDSTPNASHIRAMMLSLNQVSMKSEASLESTSTKNIIFNENLIPSSSNYRQ